MRKYVEPPGRTPPRLQPPGAGLPAPELFVARLLFHWQAWRATRAGAAALFTRQRVAILRLARGVDPAEGGRRVLITRLPGLEDSSRHWSVFMTVDHLRIVNAQIAEVIRLLGRGEAPTFAASTAAVKPRVGVNDAVIGEFEAACDGLEQAVAGVSDLRTPLRLAHPWFGPLDAAGWHFLAAFHMRLHHCQITMIRQTAPAAP